jgi:hypothetical protein
MLTQLSLTTGHDMNKEPSTEISVPEKIKIDAT